MKLFCKLICSCLFLALLAGQAFAEDCDQFIAKFKSSANKKANTYTSNPSNLFHPVVRESENQLIVKLKGDRLAHQINIILKNGYNNLLVDVAAESSENPIYLVFDFSPERKENKIDVCGGLWHNTGYFGIDHFAILKIDHDHERVSLSQFTDKIKIKRKGAFRKHKTDLSLVLEIDSEEPLQEDDCVVVKKVCEGDNWSNLTDDLEDLSQEQQVKECRVVRRSLDASTSVWETDC